MISCCIFGLATRLNVISQNSETYQTLVGKFLLFFPKSGSQTLNFLLMWPEIIILLKKSMCNDLCVPVLVKPTNDVTLFMLCPSPSPDTFRFVMWVRQFHSFTDGYPTFWIDLTVVTCIHIPMLFQLFFSNFKIVQGICHQVKCNWPILQDEAKKLCPLRCLLMLWPKKLTQNNDFLPVYGVF